MRAFRSLDRFDRSRPLRPWLMRITLNLARNRRRSVARYLSAVERWFQLEGREQAVTAGPLESRVSTDEARRLRIAVDQLAPSDREVVYMRYFLGAGESDAADALGVPVGTVKSRLSRALARLRTIVEADFPDLRRVLES